VKPPLAPTPGPRRLAALLAALLALAAPAAAGAQLSNAEVLESGLPASLALPAGGVASAEEPNAITVNPAGIGFVRDACLQWFHEEKAVGRSVADGLYLAGAIGPIGGGFSMEWVRPEVGYGYLKVGVRLAAGGRARRQDLFDLVPRIHSPSLPRRSGSPPPRRSERGGGTRRRSAPYRIEGSDVALGSPLCSPLHRLTPHG